VTVNVPGSVVLPAASLALHVTVEVPSGNVPLLVRSALITPAVAVQAGWLAARATLSAAFTAYVTAAVVPTVVVVMFAGTVNTGFSASCTVTANDRLVLLAGTAVSIAVQVTFDVPTGKVPPVVVTLLTPSDEE
jgi:hypothetical protein